MSRKYKFTVLAIVGFAVIAIILFSNPGLFESGKEEDVPAGDRFKVTEDPYSAYNQALEEDRPVVIEFYARW